MSRKSLYESFTDFLVYRWSILVQVGHGLLLLLILSIAPIAYYVHYRWEQQQRPKVIPVVTKAERETENYWYDRARREITAIQANDEAEAKKVTQLQECLAVLVKQAAEADTPYRKARALLEIALAQTSCDLDLNIYVTIKGITGAPTINAMRCRALGSIALMYMRLNNESASRSAIDEYLRVSYENDLRLDSEDTILAFISVTTAMASAGNRSGLEQLFKQVEMTNRRIAVVSALEMSRRILAGQQARVGMKWDAIATAENIEQPVEQSRAFQLIIAAIARSERPFDLKDPQLQPLSTKGPWQPIANPAETRQGIDAVFRAIAKTPDVLHQTLVLQNMAGSRLMCDAGIFPFFEKELETTDLFDAKIKSSILALLKEPRSNTIRAARGLPLHPETAVSRPGSDTATDDWLVVDETLDTPLIPIAPETVRSVSTRQSTRLSIVSAQAMLAFGNRQDARAVLEKAFENVAEQQNLYYRLHHLQSIGSLQVNAGDLDEAKRTLAAAREAYRDYAANRSALGVTVTESLPAEIATAQVRGRLLDDAVETIRLLSRPNARNDLLVQVIREQLRSEQWQAAKETIALLQDDSRKEELSRRAEGEGATPENVADHLRTVFRLIQAEEFAAAAALLPGIDDLAGRQTQRLQIVRGLSIVGRPYLGRDNASRRIRLQLLTQALELARQQETPLARVIALEVVVTAFAPGRISQELLQAMSAAVREVETILAGEDRADNSVTGDPRIPEVLSRLALARLMLVVPEERLWGDWPVVSEEKNGGTVSDVMQLLDRAVTLLHDDHDAYQWAATMTNAVQGYSQIGRTDLAVPLAEKAFTRIRQLPDKERAIPLIRQLAVSALKAGDTERGRNLFAEAIEATSAVGVGTELAPEQWSVLGLRVRERVLEDIVRDQLRQRLLDDAFRSTLRISESVVRDRLYRMMIYQAIFDGRLELAEEAVYKITTPSLRQDCLRDFIQARRENAGMPAVEPDDSPVP